MSKKIETVIIGGGQAGLAMSYCLKQKDHEHLVLEQSAQPANAWRNGRWDSFTLVTPNWSVQLPGAEYQGDEPKSFMSRNEVVAYMEEYVSRFKLPIRFETRVNEVKARSNGGGYHVVTDDDVIEASNVVVATGMYQQPRIPPFSSDISPDIDQIHSSEYRNPAALATGSVLVVGSGQSGAQIAEELYKSGRKVYLCVGSAGRGPRRYRGKDIYDWLILTGFSDRTAEELPSPKAKYGGSVHVSGGNGGHSLNLHQFARDGVVLLGRMESADGDQITLKPDLKDNLEKVDQFERELTKMVDGYIEKVGLDAPEEDLPQLKDGFETEMLTDLDLNESGIATIIWATGYTFDFSIVKLPIFDEDGYPVQDRGATGYPGLYFLGLPWLHTVKSGLLIGVGKDAEYLSSVIEGK